MIALALSISLAAAAAPAPAADAADRAIAPIAVMPFKDLTSDPDLAWLSVGIAETMMVDLKKGSHMQVVERDQLDHALQELKLQGLKPTDESSAAKLGKMVGARTVVLGSIQKAGRELRIVARFVDVETGVVKEAAKVTGETENVFDLQDAIVVKLAGTPFQDAVKRHRKKSPKTFDAYKLYAMSFETMTDADRAGLLQKALKEDPDFEYAADDLLDLQDRIQRMSQAHEVEVSKQIEAFRATMRDSSKSPQERLTAAIQLVGQDMANRRYHAGLRDTEWILGSNLPNDTTYNIRQYALFNRMNMYTQLKEQSLAMQVAENFMQLYPGSVYFVGVQAELNAWSSERARQLEFDRQYDAQLTLKRSQIAREQAALQGRTPRVTQEVGWQFDICGVAESMRQHRAAADCIQDLLDHRNPDPGVKVRYDGARMRLIREAIDAAEFERARREALRFQKEDPETALRFSVNMVLLTLPED